MYLKGRVKKGLAFLFAVLLISSLIAGCGQNRNEPSSTTVQVQSSQQAATAVKDMYDPSEKVELTLWSAPNGVYTDGQQPGEFIAQNLIPEWNKKFPNAEIDVQLIPWDGIAEKISVAIQSKTLPDIYFDGALRILSYANMGVVESLNDVIPAEDMAKFNDPAIMAYCSVNNKDLIVMPYSKGGTLMIVNKTIWEQANAADLLPQDEFRTWTLDEFKTALKAVANKEKGIYGLTLFALNEQGDQLYNNIMIGVTGKDQFSADLKKYVVAEDPESERVLAFFKSLVDEGLVTPHPETLSATNAWDYFKQGKNGMVSSGAGHPDIINSGIKDGSIKEPFNYMFVNYPSAKKGEALSISGFGQDCAFKTGDPVRVKWAKRFLLWEWTETDMRYTVGKGFDATGKPQTWAQNDPELRVFTKIMGKGGEWKIIQPTFGVKGYSEMRAAMFPELQSMFINASTPNQTINNIAARFNEIIEKNNK